jgi:hypothetical protein
MNKDISIHDISFDDCLLLYSWVNNEDSIKNKLTTSKKIILNEHKKWFKDRIADPNTFIWIIKDKFSNKIGQIRFQMALDGFYDIDIFIIKSARRSGIASKAIKMAQIQANAYPLRAIIKKSNHKSYLYFLSNGFKLISEDEDLWQLVLSLT